MDSNFEIIELPKENWKGVTIPYINTVIYFPFRISHKSHHISPQSAA